MSNKRIKSIILSLLFALALFGCGEEKKHIAGDKDQQICWNSNHFTASDKGYYFIDSATISGENDEIDFNLWGGSVRVYYYDAKNDDIYPWCYKAGCNHSTLECNGVFDSEKYLDYIKCYDNYIFLVVREDSGIYLERFELDGTNQKRVTRLADGDSVISDIQFHRGYVYFSTEDGLYYSSLGSEKEPKILKALDKDNDIISSIKALEDDLFYVYASRGEMVSQYSVYHIDLTDYYEEELLSTEQSSRFWIVPSEQKEIYYYKSEIGLCKYNYESKEETVIMSEAGFGMTVYSDGDNIYIDNVIAMVVPDAKENKRQLRSVSKDGTVLYTVELISQEEEIGSFYGTDGKYWFGCVNGYLVISKYANIVNGNVENYIQFDPTEMYAGERTSIGS